MRVDRVSGVIVETDLSRGSLGCCMALSIGGLITSAFARPVSKPSVTC